MNILKIKTKKSHFVEKPFATKLKSSWVWCYQGSYCHFLFSPCTGVFGGQSTSGAATPNLAPSVWPCTVQGTGPIGFYQIRRPLTDTSPHAEAPICQFYIVLTMTANRIWLSASGFPAIRHPERRVGEDRSYGVRQSREALPSGEWGLGVGRPRPPKNQPASAATDPNLDTTGAHSTSHSYTDLPHGGGGLSSISCS